VAGAGAGSGMMLVLVLLALAGAGASAVLVRSCAVYDSRDQDTPTFFGTGINLVVILAMRAVRSRTSTSESVVAKVSKVQNRQFNQ
jgi:hypothetical protein